MDKRAEYQNVFISEERNFYKRLLYSVNQYALIYMASMAGFFVPFLLGHPQELVGVVVNAMLTTAAIEASSLKSCLPVALAPSLGVLCRGLIFGPYTPYLAVMVPFIWTGNLVLMYLMRLMKKIRKENYWTSLGVGAVAKVAILYSSALLLVSAKILPPIFLTTMGVVQLWTALGGGILAFCVVRSGLASKLIGLGDKASIDQNEGPVRRR